MAASAPAAPANGSVYGLRMVVFTRHIASMLAFARELGTGKGILSRWSTR